MSTAILIDPNIPIVDEVDIDLNSLPVIYSLLGCQYIEVHRLPGDSGDWFIIDEQGKLHERRQAAWMFRSFPEVLVGRALIVAVDFEGGSISPRSTLMDVADMVLFDPRMAQDRF